MYVQLRGNTVSADNKLIATNFEGKLYFVLTNLTYEHFVSSLIEFRQVFWRSRVLFSRGHFYSQFSTIYL